MDAVGERLDDLFGGPHLSAPLILLAVFVSAFVATRISRWIIRRTIRRVSRRSLVLPLSHGAMWGTGKRTGAETTAADAEQRRRQRADAAARMVSHLVAVVIWIVATIVAFHLLDIDAAFFLSSAGFIGAAIAIGGQHKVNDYLTGIGVLFEDRYSVGDEIVVDPGDGVPVTAVVDHIGLFSTRLKDSRSTLHVPNSALTTVRNLSQEAAVSTIRLHVPGDATADDAMSTLRGLAGTDGLTDVIFVGDLDAHAPSTGEVEVEVRTARTLDDRSRSRLVRRAEALLDP
jgi:small conductance mechanosensitive channel